MIHFMNIQFYLYLFTLLSSKKIFGRLFYFISILTRYLYFVLIKIIEKDTTMKLLKCYFCRDEFDIRTKVFSRNCPLYFKDRKNSLNLSTCLGRYCVSSIRLYNRLGNTARKHLSQSFSQNIHFGGLIYHQKFCSFVKMVDKLKNEDADDRTCVIYTSPIEGIIEVCYCNRESFCNFSDNLRVSCLVFISVFVYKFLNE